MTDNPFVIDTELSREPGNSRSFDITVTLIERLGTDVIAVPAGAGVHLDLLLESVMDGILVTGTVSGTLEGQCVRCLADITEEFDTPLTELYAYPEMVEDHPDEEEDPVPVVHEETIDLTDLVVDTVVPDLPFNPVCQEDCPGLCPQCGINLFDHPDHEHEAPIDPRWAALGRLTHRDDDPDSGVDPDSDGGVDGNDGDDADD